MTFVGQILNLTCLVLVTVSVVFYWSNKKLENEIAQLSSDAENLRIELEKVHQTCKDEAVGAFPRIPATHIVTHSDNEIQGLDIAANVTFVLLYLADNKDSWTCITTQVKSITDAFPKAKIFETVVTQNAENVKLVLGRDIKVIGMFRSKPEALNMAIKQVTTPYFLILQPDFVIEPNQADTSIEWLHHALVITPGVDIIGGSVLLSNNELVVPCYSLNLCNWTLTQNYEYERSFGEIMICDEVSHSFLARTDIIPKFNGELFAKNMEAGNYMFIDFFLRAKSLQLTVANRPEVLFVQKGLCGTRERYVAANMEAAVPFSKKHQVMQFKDSENKIHSICEDTSKNACTIEKMVKDFNFPQWYASGMFAYPFVVQQAVNTLEIMSEKLHKAGILFALRGETLFGAVMTKSILPWGKLDAVQLSVFGVKTDITKFAATNGYQHNFNGDAISLTVQVPGFSAPMMVEMVIKPLQKDTTKFVNVRVNGKLYPVASDLISELKRDYGERYLAGEDGKAGMQFSCTVKNHHACLPAMAHRGASTYHENFCEI